MQMRAETFRKFVEREILGSDGIEPELFAGIVIRQLMECELAERLCFPRAGADPVTAGIGGVERIPQSGERSASVGSFTFAVSFTYSIIEEPRKQSRLRAYRLKAGGIHFRST
jgi:hypothetical protein